MHRAFLASLNNATPGEIILIRVCEWELYATRIRTRPVCRYVAHFLRRKFTRIFLTEKLACQLFGTHWQISCVAENCAIKMCRVNEALDVDGRGCTIQVWAAYCHNVTYYNCSGTIQTVLLVQIINQCVHTRKYLLQNTGISPSYRNSVTKKLNIFRIRGEGRKKQ